jgi:hypothetical protein
VKWEAPFGGSADAVGVVLGPVREGLSPPRRALRVTAGCEARGPKPKRFPFHPGAAGKEKTGGKRMCFPAPGRHPVVLG